MKTIMITGASGLIGSHLVTKAKMEGMRVIAVTQEKYGDLTETSSWLLPRADYIIHAAGYAQPSKYTQVPIKTIMLNTVVTMNLFKNLNPGGRFLFLSSAAVCGDYAYGHPRACYIEGKRCGEIITRALGGRVARVSLAYGPGTKRGDTRVMNQFIEQAITKGKIVPHNLGTAERTYCYISDTVKMLWNILLRGKNDLYNVGGVSHVTINELAQKIGRYMNVPVIFPAHDTEPPGAPADECLDIYQYVNEFGKENFVSLDEGLARTIEYQKELYR